MTAKNAAGLHEDLAGALAPIIVGQAEALEELTVALLAGGHVLFEGVPGVAKTLLAKSFAKALALDYGRVQFTPDLMPSDITGTPVYLPQEGRFVLTKGPVFTELLLADEINRTPPKTQAALLEAMEEHQVTIGGETHQLGDTFFVVATQNPLEYEGTYPLPEAQTDRFLLKILVDYPSTEENDRILRRHHEGFDPHDLSRVEVVADRARLAAARADADAVKVDDTLFGYLSQLVEASRTSPRVRLGASPRGGVALLRAAKARAALMGSDFLTPDEVKSTARPVLRHRLLLEPEAEIEGLSVDDVIGEILDEVDVPR
ncbi:MAG: MoxR family ATPase [Deltaproteobacteria bacterium]|nr:MoxR family ATPase [Deltaproteobacteria bacterium]